jgi:hypothetical protein
MHLVYPMGAHLAGGNFSATVDRATSGSSRERMLDLSPTFPARDALTKPLIGSDIGSDPSCDHSVDVPTGRSASIPSLGRGVMGSIAFRTTHSPIFVRVTDSMVERIPARCSGIPDVHCARSADVDPGAYCRVRIGIQPQLHDALGIVDSDSETLDHPAFVSPARTRSSGVRWSASTCDSGAPWARSTARA